MHEYHSEPLEGIKYDFKPETLKKINKVRIHSKSMPPKAFPSLISSNQSLNSTSLKGSQGITDEFSSDIQKKLDLSSSQQGDTNIKKNKRRRLRSSKLLFALISQEEADIYIEEAMLNLGYIESDLEYASKDEIQSFTTNSDLMDIVAKELNGQVDERKKRLEIEKRNIYFNKHLKSNSVFLIHSKKSPKKSLKLNSISDNQLTDFQVDNSDLTYGNGYNCSTDFQRAVNNNEDRIRRVVTQHKKVVTKAVFDALRTHYQCNKDADANERYTAKIEKTQKMNQTLTEKNRDRYSKVKKERKIEINKKKQKMKEKIAEEDDRLNKLYSDRFNRVTKLHFKNEEKQQRAAEVREGNMLRTIDELASKSPTLNAISSSSDSASISTSALVPQSNLNQSSEIYNTKQESSPSKNSSPNQTKKKKVDELDLELHPEEPYSHTQLIRMIGMNKIIEREARLYGRLAEFEEQRAIKKAKAQKEFERKQKVIAEAREKQLNSRLSLQKRNEERMKKSEVRIDEMADDYRKFLIKRSTEEAETAIRLKKLKSADLKARKKRAEELVEREKARMLNYNEMKRAKMNVFEEKRLMEDLRQSRAQKDRLIFDRKEDARKRARERKFKQNQDERKELLIMENEYIKSYENKIDRHISDFESIFSSQMELARSDPNVLGKLAEMYNVDINEIDEKAHKASSNSVPINDYIESLKDAKNEIDIKTAKEIIFETTNVRIDPKDDQSESYIYSDYNSSFESDVE